MQKTKAKLNVKVKDLMTTEVVTFKPSDKIREVAETLRAKKISGAPVVDEQGKVVGVVSEADIMKLNATIPFPVVDPLNPFGVFPISAYFKEVERVPEEVAALFEGEVREVMTRKPVTISPDASISDAARIMHKNDFNRIPVVNEVEAGGGRRGGRLVGIIARADVIRVFVK